MFSALVFCLLLFAAAGSPAVRAQTDDGALTGGGEYKVSDGVCLTNEKRAEIQAQIRESIERLKREGKLSEPSSYLLPPSFIFPVRGLNGASNDFGVHGISNFVDQNPAFPNQLLDYNCGARTYDQASGYNHKGVDIFTFPFGWNKMDRNEAAIVAADAGTIILKSDNNPDRSCGLNGGSWNAVYLQHADGTISWYGHMKKNSLTTKPVGATVQQGEYLGIVGSSGNSTGPHLHLELYSPTSQLQDPYQGSCNTLNNFSYWQAQAPYRDSRINKLMTGSAAPNFNTCPNPESENEKTVFQPGETVYVSAYFRDQMTGHVADYSLIQPNGAVFQNWQHTSPNTYSASYWWWTRPLPANAQQGVWKLRAVYQNQTFETTFRVGNATRAPFDFDGDNKTDVSIYRPSLGEWWYLRSTNGTNYAAQFGAASDKLTPADFTGDGKTDIAFFRPSTGFWFVLRSEDASFYSYPFGTNGDVPVVGDFDSDGKADTGVFRPSNATWYIRKSSDGAALIQQFGQNGDLPVVADYDGDGKSDIAIYRPSLGQWWIQRSTAGTIAFQFGNAADKPVPGDFTGDGKSDVAFFRPSTGEWYVLRSENQSFYSFPFGANGDKPLQGDFDGDGKADAGVFRSSNSTWYVNRSSSTTLIQSFGIAGDDAVPAAFVP